MYKCTTKNILSALAIFARTVQGDDLIHDDPSKGGRYYYLGNEDTTIGGDPDPDMHRPGTKIWPKHAVANPGMCNMFCLCTLFNSKWSYLNCL